MEQLLRLDLEDTTEGTTEETKEGTKEGRNAPIPSPSSPSPSSSSLRGEEDELEGLEAGAGGAGSGGGGGGGDGGGGFRAVSFSNIWEMVGSFKHRLCKKGLKGRVREEEGQRYNLYSLMWARS